jgi:hypothetical protein
MSNVRHFDPEVTIKTGQINSQIGLVAGTLVQTVSGSVPIESIEVGDSVLAFSDPSSNFKIKKVVRRHVADDVTIRRIEYINEEHPDEGRFVHLAANCLLWVPETDWCTADSIESGSFLGLKNGSRAVLLQNLTVYRTRTPDVGWFADYEDADRGAEFNFVERILVADGVFGDLSIQESTDRLLKVRVHAIELEEGLAYCVGEHGILVRTNA